MPSTDQLGKLLLRQKLVAPAELARALSEQQQSRGRLGAILVRRGSVPEDELVRVLAGQLKLPVARIRGKTVKAELLELVPAQLAEKYRCLPLFRRREEGGSVLVLALEDPSDRAALDELAFQLGERLQPVLIGPSELEDAIQRHYHADTLTPSGDALPPLPPPRPPEPEEDTETAPELPPADPLLHPAPAALQGDRATAGRYSARLRDEAGRRAWAAYYQARIAALLGDEEEALALLGEAAADVYLPFWLHRDQDWEAMRGKPEIQKMMRPWEEPRPTDEIALFD